MVAILSPRELDVMVVCDIVFFFLIKMQELKQIKSFTITRSILAKHWVLVIS